MGGGGCHWQKEMEVVRITLLQVRVRVLFFFLLGGGGGIGWKSISFTSSFFFVSIHGPCGLQFFLYETPRSKLNLFIQISLNATPPPKKKKKPGSTYLHSFGEKKKNSCFRVYYYGLQVLSTSHLFENYVPGGKLIKSGKDRLSRWCIFYGVSGIDITGLVLSGAYLARHPPCQIAKILRYISSKILPKARCKFLFWTWQVFIWLF